MLRRIKTFFRNPKTRPLFIIGTGRSGTHWLANTLNKHPEITTTIEEQPIFGLSQRMAQNPALEEELLSHLVFEYKKHISSCSSRYYLDKSHPNIWIAEKLKKALPQALFLGIQRNPYATVASMLRHKGVLSWHQRWREFPLPNRFLGITSDQSDAYENLPLATKCAIRWVAHKNRMKQLRSTLGEDLLLISYECFQKNTDGILSDLHHFLGLHDPIPNPDIRRGSLDEWKRQLSPEEIAQIQSIVGFGP
jgi:hypothetical protein